MNMRSQEAESGDLHLIPLKSEKVAAASGRVYLDAVKL